MYLSSSNEVLKMSMDGGSANSLEILFQCLIALGVEGFNFYQTCCKFICSNPAFITLFLTS